MNILYCFIFFALSINLYGQKPFREIIETDSSRIEIIRNSVYRCYEETYKSKDSIWWNVSYIDDTTQLHTEGWKKKSGKCLGIWKEYTREGVLMYTWDYDSGICEVNKSIYPYHDLLEQMKTKADSLIISAYSKDFFKEHVRFNYDCYAYCQGSYAGTWTEPMKKKPTEFLFRYSVKLSGSEWYDEMIGIKLDSLGNYLPNYDSYNNYGFEKVEGQNKIFQIDKNKATITAKQHGLTLSDSSVIFESLTWEKFKKEAFFNGQFIYYIAELTDKVEYTEGTDRKGIVSRFNVYTFNPWTGAFIEKKKMKSIREWGKNSGHATGLLADKG